jgi:hypothetical protein
MTKESISTKLSEFFELHKSGALTKEEYDSLKSQLINSGESKESIANDKDIPALSVKETGIETSPVVELIHETSPNLLNETGNQSSVNKSDKNDLNSTSKKKIYIAIMIASILLILMAAIFIVTRKNNDQDSGQISESKRSKDNTSENTTPISKDKTSTWDEATATKIIMDELSKYPDWSKIPYNNSFEWNHNIVGFTKISISKKDLMVALVKSNTNNVGAYLSIFEFEDQNGWRLNKKSIAFNPSGDNMNLFRIGSDNYGFVTSRRESGAGSSWEYKQIFAFVNGDFKEIFDTAQDIRFTDQGVGYFNIVITPQGGQPETYKFNGDKYVLQK